MFKNLTKVEKSWVLYDVGNSAFTMLACSLIPIWFKSLAIGDAPGQITGDQATAYYSIAIAVAASSTVLPPDGLPSSSFMSCPRFVIPPRSPSMIPC